jgi:hypothetical protein
VLKLFVIKPKPSIIMHKRWVRSINNTQPWPLETRCCITSAWRWLEPTFRSVITSIGMETVIAINRVRLPGWCTAFRLRRHTTVQSPPSPPPFVAPSRSPYPSVYNTQPTEIAGATSLGKP